MTNLRLPDAGLSPARRAAGHRGCTTAAAMSPRESRRACPAIRESASDSNRAETHDQTRALVVRDGAADEYLLLGMRRDLKAGASQHRFGARAIRNPPVRRVLGVLMLDEIHPRVRGMLEVIGIGERIVAGDVRGVGAPRSIVKRPARMVETLSRRNTPPGNWPPRSICSNRPRRSTCRCSTTRDSSSGSARPARWSIR